jgi:hypothetical protein
MTSPSSNPRNAYRPVSSDYTARSILGSPQGPSRSSSMGTPGLTPSPGASPALSRTATGFQTQPPSATASPTLSRTTSVGTPGLTPSPGTSPALSRATSGLPPQPPNSSAPSNAAIKAANEKVKEIIAKLTTLKDTKLSNAATGAERDLLNSERVQIIIDLQGALTEYLKIKVNSLKSKGSSNVNAARLSQAQAQKQVEKLQEQVDNNMKFFTDSIGIFGKLNEEITKLT